MKGKNIMENENQLYKANEVLQYKYISIPKELFINPQYSKLSSDSKLIYGFILDRFELSIKNKWADEKIIKLTDEELKGVLEVISLNNDIQNLEIVETFKLGLKERNLL